MTLARAAVIAHNARTMSHQHVAVWIDHHEARIFHVARESVDSLVVESPHHHVKRHPSVTADRHHPEDATHFHKDVIAALRDAVEILVLGPGTAKLELIKYVHKHEHGMGDRVVGVETVDHPTDKQIVAYARKYFEAADRMR